MEHVVQFGITIDDDAIKQTIHRNVEKQIIGELKKDVMKELVGKKDFSNYEYTYKLKGMIEDSIGEFLEVYKQDIIDTAANKLADRLSKTKAVKEALGKTIDEIMSK